MEKKSENFYIFNGWSDLSCSCTDKIVTLVKILNHQISKHPKVLSFLHAPLCLI